MLAQDMRKYSAIDRFLDQVTGKLIVDYQMDLNDEVDKELLTKLAAIQNEVKDIVIRIDDAINANR